MSSKPIIDFLTKQIFIERNIVTYRSLSRELQLHVNVAKNELAIYHDNAPYQSQTSYATYLLCGEIEPPDTDDMDVDYDKDDPYGEFEDDGDEVPQTKLLLVNEHDLEDAKTQFTSLNSIHVYSLSPSALRDSGHICAPTDQVHAIDRGNQAKEMVKIVGKVVSSNMKVVHSAPKPVKTTRQPVAGPSKLKPVLKEKEASVESPKAQKIAVDKPKEKEKPKVTGKLDFSKAKHKEKTSNETTEASKVKKGKEDAAKKEKAEEKDKDKKKQSAPIKGQKKKTLEPTKRGTKRKSALDVSDEEEEERPSKVPSRRPSPLPPAKESVRLKGNALISDDEEEEVVEPTRKSRKGHASAVDSDNEDVLAMMDIADDQVTRVTRQNKIDHDDKDEDENVKETEPAPVEEDVDMIDDTLPKAKPKKRAPKKVIPVGSNGLKKRRVIKSRSTLDDKGYMVFEDYSEYESVDENEPEPEPVKRKGRAKAKQESDDESPDPAEKPKPAAKAPQKAPAKTKMSKPAAAAKGGQKQGTIAGFFTAKPKK